MTESINIIRLNAKYLLNDAGSDYLTLQACADDQGMIEHMVASLGGSQAQMRFLNGKWAFNEQLDHSPFFEYEDLLNELEKEVLHAFAGDECRIADREFLSRFNVKNSHVGLRLKSPVGREQGESEIKAQFKDIDYHKYSSWGGTVSSTRIANAFSFWTP